MSIGLLEDRQGVLLVAGVSAVPVLIGLKADGYVDGVEWREILVLPLAVAIVLLLLGLISFYFMRGSYLIYERMHARVVGYLFKGLTGLAAALVITVICLRGFLLHNSTPIAAPAVVLLVLYLVVICYYKD